MDPFPTGRPVTLVTGAARGIGQAVTHQLAATGHGVVVTARDPARAAAQADLLRGEGAWATSLGVDLSDSSSIEALADSLDGRPLDGLVAKAAAFAEWTETASTADLTSARSVVETNLFGTWHVLQAALPALRRAPEALVAVVTSGSGSFGDPQFGLTTGPAAVSYAVSKAALNALVVKLAAELKGTTVRVNAVDPGLTATAPGMAEMGARPVADGAASVLAALLTVEGTGTFTRDGQTLPW